MAAYGTPDVAIAGLLIGADNDVESAIAQEDIAFGAPVYGPVGVFNKAYNAHKDKVTVTLSADLVTSNVITTVINGTSVATTFATDHATTMTTHIAAIVANSTLATAGISAAAGATNRAIIISGPAGVDIATVTCVVTLGASQATSTIVFGTNLLCLGVAVFIQTGGKDFGAGTSGWKNKDSINILRTGMIWVPAESTVSDKKAAYAVIGGTGTIGKFTNIATNNYDIGGYFRSNLSGGLAVLEVRGIK